MPILKHAKKKLKQDKKRTIKNKKIKDTFKSLVKKAKESNSPEAVSKAFSAVDKAAKKNILSKNKAAHLKSSLAKQSESTGATKPVTTKKTTAKVEKTSKTTTAAKPSKSTGAKKAKLSSKK